MPRQLSQNSIYDQQNLATNNNDYEVVKNYKEDNTKITARKRWKILAKVLFKNNKDDVADISVRRFTSFGVFAPTSKNGNWFEYTTKDKKFSLVIQHLHETFSVRDLIGFNNTGNICVWPSEETLAMYITSNLNMFTNKSVMELGGGMSCMAGLVAAKYAETLCVLVTDGNTKSIENVQGIIKKNLLQDKAECSVLQWQDVKDIGANSVVLKRYDVILAADCLFFDEVREDLINTIWLYLTDNGTAYVMAPQRGNTLDLFITTSKEFGFSCKKVEEYDQVIWERHLQLMDENANYDPSLHYPILVILTK